MTTATIVRDVQKSFVDTLVSLWTLDTTVIGGVDILYFVDGTKQGEPVAFGGQTYTPFPVSADGFEWNGSGQLPSPTLTVGAIAQLGGPGLFNAYLQTLDDLVGAQVTRIRTFAKYLDGQPGADSDAHFEPDVFRIEQKSQANKNMIQFKLSSVIDQQGRFLPNRQVLRDTCTRVYRIYKDGAFVYTKATCPYVGTSYFKSTGDTTVDATQDRCGKRVSDCKLRFGTDQILPGYFFPGVSRFRVGS